jgi:hypothetical protein
MGACHVDLSALLKHLAAVLQHLSDVLQPWFF